MISSIPIGGSINPEGFLPSILLMVIMVMVVIVAVILVVVVVVVIFGVVVVVGGVSSIIKLSFMIIGFLRIIMFYYLLHQPLAYGNGFLQRLRLQRSNISFNTSSPGDLIGLFYSNRLGICIPPGQGIIGQSTSSKCHSVFLGTLAMRKYRFSMFKPANEDNNSFRTIGIGRAADTTESLEFKTSRDRYEDNGASDPIAGLGFKGLRNSDGSLRTGLLPSGRVDLTGDEDPTNEDGDVRMDDSIGVSMSLGGEIS
ncbi:hypothetical protein Tco_0646858 [Tanacetum coccineum]